MWLNHFGKTKRWIALSVFAAFFLFALPLNTVTGEIETAVKHQKQVVRVLLTRLGLTDRLDVTLASPYVISLTSGQEIHFNPLSELSFVVKNNKIYLYYQGMAVALGKEVNMLRTDEEETVGSGFYVTNFPALYMGDLLLDLEEGNLRPVLKMHVEDYLLGVVPYEMGESFPLEALKAQAVAARTYVLRKQDLSNRYDVVDNTNDQAFRGYLPGNTRSEQAVLETRGICGFSEGELAQCFYSASNGGQMELPETVWPGRVDVRCYAFGEDPYDVENPLSVVRSYEIPKNNVLNAPLSLMEWLSEELQEQLEEYGFDPSPESICLDKVHGVAPVDPVEEGSKVVTKLRMELSVSGRTKKAGIVRVEDLDQQEVNLFTVPAAVSGPSETIVPLTTDEPEGTPAPVYGSFVPIKETFTVEIPIFPAAEAMFGLNILAHFDNEIWSVRETENSFVLEARRYGHGVGMSQRGAQWMAGSYGKTFQEILSFYYPGMKLYQFAEEPYPFYQTDELLQATAGPAPSPTPRPTLMPTTMKAEEGQWFASVTEISEDSSLNLRAEPSLNADILMRLYKNQRLLVLEEAAEGWVKVRTDTVEGYVMESYLSAEK